MCGIAGMSGEHREDIAAMVRALRHRGPDGDHTAVESGASLGHARLAILDPRPVGDQPMWNADRTVAIVFNGEIYNYRRLREEEGFSCETNTDTEVLLKLYERYGLAFLPRLQGMFAFAVFDARDRSWKLARDRSGIKPLYVSLLGGELRFASEVRSILASFQGKPALNMRALSRFQRLQYVPEPDTLCEGIDVLRPGHTLTWKDGVSHHAPFESGVHCEPFRSPADFREIFPGLMRNVVKDHLLSDKPVGVFLSGGMDSSIVLHHAAEATAGAVKTFTVRFDATEEEGAGRFNADASLATLTAKHYGTEHADILLTAKDQYELYRDTVRSLDQPNADTVSVAQYLLAKVAKRTVDVALTGAGGDELFGGYPRYRIARMLRDASAIPGVLRGAVGGLLGYPTDVLRLSPGPLLAERLLARPAGEIAGYVRGSWFDADATTRFFAERYPSRGHDALRRFMEFDRHTWLIDESLRLVDGTSMGSGLEARVPFLDERIIAAALATPGGWHVDWRRTKKLLKDTYRGILPEHLYALPKASFYPPVAKWLRREAAPLIEEALAQPRMKEFFDLDALRRIAKDHAEKRAYHLHTLSSVIQLGHWFDAVYDAPIA
jgi:asparagine synthase (glutamine-hydrolysing)